MRIATTYLAKRSLTLATLLATLACAQPVLAQDDQSGQTSTDAVVKALITAAQDDNESVRISTLPLLGQFMDREDVVKVIVGAAEDEEMRVRYAALTELIKLDGPTDEVLSVIVKRGVEFHDLGNPRGRGSNWGRSRDGSPSSPRGIARFGESAIPHLIEVLKSNADAKFKIGACQVFQNMRATGAGGIPILVKLISDSEADAQVRVAAANAATTIDKSSQPVAQQFDLEPRFLAYAESLVSKNDKNEDDLLSPDEFPQTRIVNLSAADFNGDGKLTPEEIARQMMLPDEN